MSSQTNAGAWPDAKSKLRFVEQGHVVEVTLDWPAIRALARRAVFVNAMKVAREGPVYIREVKP